MNVNDIINYELFEHFNPSKDIVLNGKVIYPKYFYIAVVTNISNAIIDNHIIAKQVIMFKYQYKLYYLDMKDVYDVFGNPFDLGSNIVNMFATDNMNNKYYMPIIASFTGHVYEIKNVYDIYRLSNTIDLDYI